MYFKYTSIRDLISQTFKPPEPEPFLPHLPNLKEGSIVCLKEEQIFGKIITNECMMMNIIYVRFGEMELWLDRDQIREATEKEASLYYTHGSFVHNKNPNLDDFIKWTNTFNLFGLPM